MKTETKKFQASTHYNDWYGTISADDMDVKNIHQYFKNIINDEHIIGVEASIYYFPEVSVTIYTTNESLFNEDGSMKSKKYPVLKEYKKDMPIEAFLKLFKQFNFKFSPKNQLKTRKIKVTKA